MLIQRLIEFLSSLPTLPIWMALAVAVPSEWDPIAVYFMITVILSIVSWTGLARVVRGKLLQLRVEDYVLAAKIAGATEMSTIVRHLLPGFMSFLIVHLTLAIPGMILGETALSFIGVGLRAPVVSWGVLLQQAQNIRSVSLSPWLLIPAIFVIITVLCFNFVGRRSERRRGSDPGTADHAARAVDCSHRGRRQRRPAPIRCPTPPVAGRIAPDDGDAAPGDHPAPHTGRGRPGAAGGRAPSLRTEPGRRRRQHG